MKKILFIHHSGDIGGAGVSGYNTILTLSKYFKIVVYCPAHPKFYSEFLSNRGIQVKTFDFPLGSIPYYSGGPSILSPGFIFGLINIFKYKSLWEKIVIKEKPDLLITNSKIMSWLSIIANKLNIKSVCFVRETRKGASHGLWNKIQKSFLNRFNAVIFISEYDKAQEILTKARSYVVPNYIDKSKYENVLNKKKTLANLGIPEEGFKILYVGGMLRLKGYDVLIKALKHLKTYDVHLIVAGRPDFSYKKSRSLPTTIYNYIKKGYENRIANEISRNELHGRIYKIGIRNDMEDIYEVADVLVFPARKPHQSRPVFEAGAKKVPVIMPDFDNTLEYIEDRKNGLIFKRKNSRSLAKCIIELIENPKLCKELGNDNYKRTMNNHIKEHSERKLVNAIKKTINGGIS